MSSARKKEGPSAAREPSGNDIVRRQNSAKGLRLLKASREAYRGTKNLGTLQLILAGVPPVIAAGWHSVPTAKSWAVVASIAFLLLDLILEPRKKRGQARGARIQQMFDEHVLEVPPGGIPRPDEEEISELVDGFDRRGGDVAPLKNWYPAAVAPLGVDLARLVCQRSNLQWDAKLRGWMWMLYAGALSLLGLGLLGWSLANNTTVDQALQSVALPFLPASVQLLRSLEAHSAAATESSRAKEDINALWEKIVAGDFSIGEVHGRSVCVQEGLHDRRRRAPQVPELVYWWARNAYEKHMRAAAAEMVAQVRGAPVAGAKGGAAELEAGA